MQVLHILGWLELVLFALFTLTCQWTCFEQFHALMNLKRVRDAHGLSPLTSKLAAYMLARGYFIDFWTNVVWLTVEMRELPRELTVTDRVSRLKVHGNDRQRAIASWYCDHHGLQLDDSDPSGCHCKT